MKKYSYAVEYYQKHGNLYITRTYPCMDHKGLVREFWNPLRDTSPYSETIMSEDADSNNVRSFIIYARATRSNYINHPTYSTLLNEIGMIWDIDYGKWEAKAELVTAYFVNVLNSNLELMLENLDVDDKPYGAFVYKHIRIMRKPGYESRSQKEICFYEQFQSINNNSSS